MGADVRRKWTDEEKRIMRRDFPHMPTKDVAEKLGRPVNRVSRKAYKMRLRKSPEYMASGIPGRNGGKAVPTKYQPGNIPWRYRPVGSFRVNYAGYLQKKMKDTGRQCVDWEKVHNILWEKRNGKIPEGYIVVFADGNKSNLSPDNLLLISRQEHMTRNTIMRYPPELRYLMNLQGRLTRAIKEKCREESLTGS